MPNPYVVTYDTVDELGDPEKWEVLFRRLTARDAIAAGALAEMEGVEQTRAVVDIFESITVSASRNGEHVTVEDIPFEVVVEVYAQHPSFRREDESG